MIAQNFRIRQIFSELGHTAPSKADTALISGLRTPGKHCLVLVLHVLLSAIYVLFK
jgi:hypothetical protein